MAVTFTPPLAALTTIFTPPCPITWLLTSTKVPSQIPPFPTGAPASCDPPSWDEYLSQRGFEYYSPAICPSGFYVGPSCIITSPRTGQGFPAIQGGETAAYCIPNGHTCTSDTSDFRGGVWGVSRTASVNGAQVTAGPAIQIRWREEDLDGLETDPLTPGPRTTQQPSSTQAPVETPTETDDSDQTTTTITSAVSVIITTSRTVVVQVSTTIPSSSIISSPTPSSATSPTASTPVNAEPTTPSSTPSTAATTSVSQSAQQSAAVDASTQGNGHSGSTSSNFTVAAIVLTGVLIAIIATYTGYSTLQRYKRYRAGETDKFFLFTAEAWVRRRLHLRRRSDSSSDAGDLEKAGGGFRIWRTADAELGTEGPVPELGDAKPLGTEENPAELPTVDRSSWRSRVSRILTARTQQGSKTAALDKETKA
ncbi:hypothetical protein F5Y03DRAFT_275231 [Xylaria venustula]|nr:hypothetical protein F5Y03DRAFT_275231 [Xylaria venustula]